MIFANCIYCGKSFRKRESKRKFCSLTCSNNFNKNGLRIVNLPLRSQDLAEFIGICLGDGCVSGYQVSVTLNKNADKDYIPYVMQLMQRLFPDLKVSLIEKVKDNAIDVRLYSKIVVEYLQNMGIISNHKIIPAWIFSKKEYKYACVKGLFDTEGSISFKKYMTKKGESIYKQLNFRSVDVHFMRFVRDTLLTIHLKPTITLKKSLYISNQKDIDIFGKVIGFGNPKLAKKAKFNT